MNNKKINTNNSNLPIVPLELILSLREDFGDLICREDLKLFRFDTSKYWDFNEAFANYKSLAYKRRAVAKSRSLTKKKAKDFGSSSAGSEVNILLKKDKTFSLQERVLFYEGNFIILKQVQISETEVVFLDNEDSVWEKKIKKPIVTEPNVRQEKPLYEKMLSLILELMINIKR